MRRNRARCTICDQVIESSFRHEMVSCTGGHIFVDGGQDYERAGLLNPEYQDWDILERIGDDGMAIMYHKSRDGKENHEGDFIECQACNPSLHAEDFTSNEEKHSGNYPDCTICNPSLDDHHFGEDASQHKGRYLGCPLCKQPVRKDYVLGRDITEQARATASGVTPLTFEDAAFTAAFEIAHTIIKKHKGYGPRNIADYGQTGIAIRLNDKNARVQHIVFNKGQEGDESLEETLTDVAGYGIVGLMFSRGWFTLPLEGQDENSSE